MRKTIFAMTVAAVAGAAAMAWAMEGGSGPTSGDLGKFETQPKVTLEEINAAYVEGQRAVEAADWKNAVAKFKFVTRNAAKNADGWNYLAYSSRKGGDPKASEAAYKRALRIDPNHPRANEYYGELLLELNRIADAEARLAVLNKCCATDPATAKLTSLIADAKAGKPTSRDKPALGY
jgi:Tfp pilus assembly protein PilF